MFLFLQLIADTILLQNFELLFGCVLQNTERAHVLGLGLLGLKSRASSQRLCFARCPSISLQLKVISDMLWHAPLAFKQPHTAAFRSQFVACSWSLNKSQLFENKPLHKTYSGTLRSSCNLL